MEQLNIYPSEHIRGVRVCRPIHIPQVVYKTIAEEIIDKFDGKAEYNLKISRGNGAYGWEYSIRFYVHHNTNRCPDGDFQGVHTLVPLWSEFKVWLTDEGEDKRNDFDTEKLRDHGIPYNKPLMA